MFFRLGRYLQQGASCMEARHTLLEELYGVSMAQAHELRLPLLPPPPHSGVKLGCCPVPVFTCTCSLACPSLRHYGVLQRELRGLRYEDGGQTPHLHRQQCIFQGVGSIPCHLGGSRAMPLSEWGVAWKPWNGSMAGIRLRRNTSILQRLVQVVSGVCNIKASAGYEW